MTTFFILCNFLISNIFSFNTDNIKNYNVPHNCGISDLTKDTVDVKLNELLNKIDLANTSNVNLKYLFEVSCLTYLKIKNSNINDTFTFLNSSKLKDLTGNKSGFNTTRSKEYREADIYDEIIFKLISKKKKNDYKILISLADSSTIGFSSANEIALKTAFTDKLIEFINKVEKSLICGSKASKEDATTSTLTDSDNYAESSNYEIAKSTNSDPRIRKITACTNKYISLSDLIGKIPCNKNITPTGPSKQKINTGRYNPTFSLLQLPAIAIFRINDYEKALPEGCFLQSGKGILKHCSKFWPNSLSDWDEVKKKDKNRQIATLKEEVTKIDKIVKEIKETLESSFKAVSDCEISKDEEAVLKNLLALNKRIIDTEAEEGLKGTQFLDFIKQEGDIPPAYKIANNNCVSLGTNPNTITFNIDLLNKTKFLTKSDKYDINKIKAVLSHLNDAKLRLSDYSYRLTILLSADSKQAGWWSRFFTNMNNWGFSGDTVLSTALDSVKTIWNNKMAMEQMLMDANPCKYMFPDENVAAPISPTDESTNPSFISARAYCEFMKANGDDPCQKLALTMANAPETEKQYAIKRCYGQTDVQAQIKSASFGGAPVKEDAPINQNEAAKATEAKPTPATPSSASVTKPTPSAFNKPESNDPKYWIKNSYKDGQYVLPEQKYRRDFKALAPSFDARLAKEDTSSPANKNAVPSQNFIIQTPFKDHFGVIDPLHLNKLYIK